MGHKRRDASRDIRFANALPIIDGPAFAAYVEKMLGPELEPGTVVILNNLATHKNAMAAKVMRGAGCWFLFRCSGKTILNWDGKLRMRN